MATKNSDGLDASCFLVAESPDQPSTWHLQVKDAAHKPDHRLMGGAWAALHGGYRGNKYDGPQKSEAMAKLKALYKSEGMPLPSAKMSATDTKAGKSMLAKALSDLMDSVLPSTKEPESVSMTADFSTAPATMADDMVIRTGKLFEVGNYEDKSFSLDAAEMQRAIAGFTPVALDVGDSHVPTVLEGKMGTVQRIFAGDDGKSLMGEVHLPKWLDTLLEDGGRKVSTEWDRASKSLTRLCLVRNPRVSDAALMAAFAGTRHDTPTGQVAIQRIHDAAVMGGAVCKRVGMSSRHESSAIQQMHDTAVSHGATCETTNGTMSSPLFSGQAARSKTRMNVLEWITGKAKEDEIEFDEAEIAKLSAAFSSETSTPAETTSPDPALTELATQLSARDAEIAKLRTAQEAHSVAFAQVAQERREAQAAAFTQAQVSSHRLTPSAAEKLTPIVSRILATDETVTFAEGESSTMSLLTAFAESLPDLSIFTTDTIKRDEVAALFTTTKTEGIDGDDKGKPRADVIERVKAATTVGRATLAEQNGKK